MQSPITRSGHKAETMQAARPPGGPNGGPGGGGPNGGQRPNRPPGANGPNGGGPRGGGFLARMDTNKDGAISKAELDAALTAQFKMADADHNGFLSLAEFQAMRGPGGGGGGRGQGGQGRGQ